MRNQLEPSTAAGRVFVELAETHSAECAKRADEHDRDGSFPFEAIEAMKASGFTAAPIPEEFGGGGLTSVNDLMIGINRLGRGDPAVAIAINMHFTIAWIASRIFRAGREVGDTDDAAALEGFLAFLAGGGIGLANGTEGGTDLAHPMTEAKPVEGGWRVDGHKIFGTLSPVADVMLVACRNQRADGSYARGRAVVFRGAPGQTIMDNWDAMGMRASGSHDVVYENCVVDASLYAEGGDWGEFGDDLPIVGSAGNAGLLATFLGIAESAREHIAHLVKTRKKSGRVLAERYSMQHGMAELEVSLATCRAHLAFLGPQLDALLVDRPVASVGDDEVHQLNAAAQVAKLAVQQSAIDVVDKALQLSGGAGYMSSSPLSRMYRDVRAGPFMQPLSPNEAYAYIGQIALDQPIDLDG